MTPTPSGRPDLVYHVVGLLREPIGATREYDWEALELRLDDDTPASNLSGHLRLLRLSKGILADGTARADVTKECSRCLVPVVKRVSVDFSEEFRPTHDVSSGKALPVLEDGEEEDDFFYISQNHELDLHEAVRQALILGLPVNPVCMPDCAGLCPRCGADLNVERCGHVLAPKDNRMAGLASLLDKLNDDDRRTG